MVFLNTTARLGPGDIAPTAQTKDNAKIDVKSKANSFSPELYNC